MEDPKTIDEVKREIQRALASDCEDWWRAGLHAIVAHRHATQWRKLWDVSTFSARLKTARRCIGMTREQLAMRMDLNPGRIASYEAGKRAIPADDFARMCRHLRVKPEWVLGESEEGGPPIPREQIRIASDYDPRGWRRKQQQRAYAAAKLELEKLRAKYQKKDTKRGRESENA